MRWLRNQRENTAELFPDDADRRMKELGRYSEYRDANLNNFLKTVERIFASSHHEKGTVIVCS